MPVGRIGSLFRAGIYGHNTTRVRASWRIAVPILIGLVVFVVSFVLGSMLPIPQGRAQVVPFLVTPLVVCAVVWRTGPWLDNRSIRAYGFSLSRTWWVQAGGGVILGVLIIAITLFLSVLLGSAALAPSGTAGEPVSIVWLSLFCLGFAGVALWEELVFRGVFIVNGIEGISAGGYPRTIAVSTALFGSVVIFALVHIPGGVAEGHPAWLIAMWTASLGLLTGVGFLLTGELALPMGAHFAINFVPINVIGLSPTANMTGVPTVLAIESATTGLAAPMFGPLTVANLIGCVGILGWYSWRRGGAKPGELLITNP